MEKPFFSPFSPLTGYPEFSHSLNVSWVNGEKGSARCSSLFSFHFFLIIALFIQTGERSIACLVPFFDHKCGAAFRAAPGDRLMPGRKFALRVIAATPERLPSLGSSLHDISAVFRTFDPGGQRLRRLAFRIF
jgi:hypothetical protein